MTELPNDVKRIFLEHILLWFQRKKDKKRRKKKEEHILLTFGKLPNMATHSPRESSEGEIIRERERGTVSQAPSSYLED